MSNDALARLEGKLDSLISSQHRMSEKMAEQAVEMRVRIDEFEKRLDRTYVEDVRPLKKKVEILQERQNEIASDLRQVATSLKDVGELVTLNKKQIDEMRVTRAKAAGAIATLTAIVAAASALAQEILKALVGG